MSNRRRIKVFETFEDVSQSSHGNNAMKFSNVCLNYKQAVYGSFEG